MTSLSDVKAVVLILVYLLANKTANASDNRFAS